MERFTMDPVLPDEEGVSAPFALSVPKNLHFKKSQGASKAAEETPLPREQQARTPRSVSTTSDFNESLSDDSLSEEESEEVDKSDKSPYEMILSYRQNEEGDYDYFLKLKNRPYRDCRWVKGSEFCMYPHKNQFAGRFRKKHPFPPSMPYYDPAYDEIDRIIAKDTNFTPAKYLVKWNTLGYDCCTWETEVDQESVDKFDKLNTPRQHFDFQKPEPKDFKQITEYPSPDGVLDLFAYQLEGLNWLRQRWYEGLNCILADEMGLGKTVQAVTFLVTLNQREHLPAPYLVIAPLATLHNWEREFNNWSNFNIVIYTGSKESRNTIHDYEFYYPDGSGPKFDVLVTNYELILNDTEIFSLFSWSMLVVDEAHRLKNSNSKLLIALAQLQSKSRVLLTGTPIQNNIEELQSLLEFLHPGEFQDLSTAETSSDIIQLQSKLKPHLLRRLKVDVDKTIAAKEETIIECGMSKYQKQYYRAILESNAGNLSHGSNCSNVAMELRKVCMHPFLIKGAEDKILQDYPGATQSASVMLDALVRSSGKMILIDKLLPKLFSDKHRILIFSQMTNLLDILQDYLAMKGYVFLRIDGKVRGDLRQQLIDRFNAPDSDVFVFLLCTRAGGLGINLNSADTVIIFDSDWNPQNDLQAQARCHRIGQRKTVKVYRLLTKDTYEQTMFEAASKKLGLGHAVLDKAPKKDIDMLLRKGAYHALNDVEEDNFGEQDIEEILMGSKVMVYNEAAGSTFSKANFDLTGDSVDAVGLNDPDFWQKMFPQKAEEADEVEKLDEGRMRTRHRPTMADEEDPNLDDGTSRDWKRSEREKLQHLLQWFGWDRWNDATRLTGLKRSVIEIKLASRAFLRKLLNAESDLSQYTTARMLIEKACSKEFDPNFIGDDDALAVDDDFMRQSSMIDTEFISIFQKKGSAWIKRIEMLYYLNMGVEKANRKPEDIFVPQVQGNIPAPWWVANDDRYLIYGTWKNGFSRSEEIIEDEELKFSFRTDSTKELPQTTTLTPRIRKLAHGLKKYFCSENRHNDAIPSEPNVPKYKTWLKRDKSTVLQQMLHGGVPLKENGEHDWAKFREICGFSDKTDEQMARYVEEMMDTGQQDGHDGEHIDDENIKDDDEKSAEGSGPAVTASRIKQRFESLTQLRKIFLHYSEAEVAEYFSYPPRWRNVPRTWNDKLEYTFFKEIAERGWGVCSEILKGEAFSGVFEGDPPSFVTSDARVIRRLNTILEYFQQNTLDSLRQKEAANPKTKKKKNPKVQNDILDQPNIELTPEGVPAMPLMLTSTAWIVSLGHIVTDRSGFHTERYIYPAGFKSTRLYASTLDPGHRVRYNCEIIDNGEAIPLFRVSMDENPEVKYEGNSPTSPWTLILKRILEMRTEQPKALSISGPDIYGLAAPQVVYCIQNMEGADKCVNYIPRVFSNKPAVPKSIKRRTHSDEQPKEAHPKPASEISVGSSGISNDIRSPQMAALFQSVMNGNNKPGQPNINPNLAALIQSVMNSNNKSGQPNLTSNLAAVVAAATAQIHPQNANVSSQQAGHHPLPPKSSSMFSSQQVPSFPLGQLPQKQNHPLPPRPLPSSPTHQPPHLPIQQKPAQPTPSQIFLPPEANDPFPDL